MESRRSYLGRLGLLVLVAAQLTPFAKCSVSAQDCLLTAGGEAPPFRSEDGFPRLPNGTQAIITSYKFGCCGNVTAWQTYVQPAGGNHQGVYDISFQVWRASPTVQESGCYSMVGQNRFTSISLGIGRLVSETPNPSNIITVWPGDVVGYFTISRNNIGDGIQLGAIKDTSENIDDVWYDTHAQSKLLNAGPPNCPLPVGTEIGRILTSYTNAAPILSVDVSSFTCQTTPTIKLPSSSSRHPSPMTTTTTSVHTQLSSNSVSISISPTPSVAEESAVLSTAVIATLATLGGSALLLSLLCTLVLAITLAKVQHRRQRTLAETPFGAAHQHVNTLSVRMQENEAYTPTSHVIDGNMINTESNLAYEVMEMKGNEQTVPPPHGIDEFSPTEYHLYESVTIGSEILSPDEYVQMM